jgi:hypothetical protein
MRRASPETLKELRRLRSYPERAKATKQLAEWLRRATLTQAARNFASVVLANPAMPFDALEQRVKDLAACLTLGQKGNQDSAPSVATGAKDAASSLPATGA